MASTSTNNNPSTSTTSNTASGNNSVSTSAFTGGDSRWYFTAEQLGNSPSRKQGINADDELSYRQLTAYLIQEMGQRLQVSQLCINTAIVYMHRFYAFHSFTHFHRNGIAAASLFLAAKVEEQPRKLEHVIKAANLCINQDPPANNSEVYAEQAQDLVFNENVLLQTLGFDVAIDHPHTHVVKTCHLVKACKDLAQTSYFLASNSLHLTSMCLQYRPTVVACFCIYLACKWSRWEIPQSTEGKHWFHYVDKTVTMDLLQQLTNEFIAIYEKSPARLKSKLNSVKAIAQGARIPEPTRNMSDSSNGSTSSQQLSQVPPSELQPSQPSATSSSSSSRRPDTISASHSSHHRSHHTGVQHPHHHHHHHHHSKHGNTADAIDHKQQNKPYPNSSNNNHSNRPRTDRSHQQSHIIQSGLSNDPNQYSSSKQMSSSKNNSGTSSNSGRSSVPQLANIPPIMQSQQSINLTAAPARQNLPSQLHEMGYHKNRVNTTSGNLPNQVNPQLASNHKIASKNQIDNSSRNLVKDPNSGRDPKIPVKHSSISNSGNNMYPQQQQQQQQQQSVGLDMTRNVLQQQQNQQKGYVQNSTTNTLQPPTNYQQQSNSRNSNSGNNNVNNLNTSNKYEQSVQQQALLSQHQQKQSLESSSYSHTSTTNSSSTTFNQNNSQITNDHMEICSPPRYSTGQNQVPPASTAAQPVKPFLSIFSPDYNEKQQQLSQQLPQLVNNKPILNNKLNRDSPKKEKRSGTPKKEKRSEPHHIPTDQQKIIDKRIPKNALTSNQNPGSMMPINLNYVQPTTQSQQSQLADYSYNASKRPNPAKIEEDIGREIKVRKVDHPTVEVRPASYLFDQSAQSNQSANNSTNSATNSINIQESTKTKIYPSTINGIETNPDLVSSLLKESLCNENKYGSQPSLIKTEKVESIAPTSNVANTFIKTEPKLSPIQSEYNINPMETLPQELLQDTSTYATPFVNIKQEPNAFPINASVNNNNVNVINNQAFALPQSAHHQQQQLQIQSQLSQQQQQQQTVQQQQLQNQQIQPQLQQQNLPTPTQQQNQPTDDYSKSKSEKKKKKDKHKHKEKDKSKDKEERKKHKKDKDKHKDKEKDRERNLSTSESSEPVKLKISKEKLNLPPIEAINVSPGQLKIKIPKDRIKTEMNTNDLDSQPGNTNQAVPQMPLKIKISKDKIGSFGQDKVSLTSNQLPSITNHNNTNSGGNLHSNNILISGNIAGSSNSSKKKDRDKERDKEKKNRNSDLNKHNGNGGNNSSSGMANSTTSSKSSSNKIQYSQLFGDSNDEDDDTDSDSISHPNQQIHQQQRYQQQKHKTNYSHNINNPNSSFSGTNSNSINNCNNSGGYQYSDNKKINNNNYNNNSNQQQYQQNYK